MRLRQSVAFVRAYPWRILALSALLLVPCFWHKHLEAGDLASHTYNAWLAQLISHGQAPGLYIAQQPDNILVDVTLARLGNWIGLPAAERVVACASVLIFFWGAFAFITAVCLRPPWLLTPAIAMIAYGWTFHMGFFNYYLSLGLAFFAIALVWRGKGWDWLVAVLLAALIFLAHPMGFLFLVGTATYVRLANVLRGWLRWMLFAAAVMVVVAAHFYILRFRTVLWDTRFFYQMNGVDQLALFGSRYVKLAKVAFFFAVFLFVSGAIREWKSNNSRWAFRAPLELWLVLLCSAALIPEVIFLPQYAGVAGLIVSRITSISAVLGLCILSCVRPRRWHFVGFLLLAGVFFSWVYHDTGTLSRMEAHAEALVRTLPYGRRVTETVAPPADSRIIFINHMVDRACIGHCFAYENYEASSLEFRIRIRPGSPLLTASADDSESMEEGEYIVRPEDLPMSQIYQCDEKDFTRLCIRELSAGEKNGRLGRHRF